MAPATTIAPSDWKKIRETRLPKVATFLLCVFVGIIISLRQQWSLLSDFSKSRITSFDEQPMSNRSIRDFAQGVDPVYLELLEVAERNSAADFETSHKRGARGVAIGPTNGKFVFTFNALQNAKRIRYILGNDRSVKIALMTSQEHLTILFQECSDNPKTEFAEACRLWANNTLFDDVIVTKDNEFRGNDNHTHGDPGTSNHWLKALGGYRLAPYTRTMFLDSDAYLCPGFEKLFDIVEPVNEWQIPSLAPAHFVIGIEQFRVPSPRFWNPGDDHVYEDFKKVRMRNTGVVLFHFHSRTAHTFAHFIPLVSEHVYNFVATPENKVVNDQTPFRIALFLFNRLVPEFNEQNFPMHSSCRSYPGKKHAGTDGFKNGMLPIQQDGKPCNECRCTPCRVTHFRVLKVYINGKMGWEADVDPYGFNIAEYLGVGGY
jgi:hypothetical protein